MFTPPEVKTPETYTMTYSKFKGVDFKSAITEVDPSRSPYAPNMIAQENGFPQKRTGLLKLAEYTGEIHGIHRFVKADESIDIIIHAGTSLYKLGSDIAVYSGMKSAKSTSFVMGGKLYLLDGQNYISYNGTTVSNVEDSAYVPTTTISAAPSGGGEEYEPVNLLQTQRVNLFRGTAGDTVYQLDTESISAVVKCEKLNSDGITWTAITAYTVNTSAGKVTFSTAPGVSPITGEDNVKITFRKTVTGYADKIKKCTICTEYGMNNDTRIFVSGNSGQKNYDWFSWTGNPTFFPDINYGIVGSEISPIMGYLKQYDSLVVVKKANGQDVSLFLRSAQMGSDNKIQFTLKQGISGVGAVSKYCFASLIDDPLFLSDSGVMGLDTKPTLQNTTQDRSFYINPKLLAEPGIDEAIACVAHGKYYLFINGNVYVADSTQKNVNPAKSFGYEWYYWTGINASAVKYIDDVMYIGDKHGQLHKLKTESEYGMEAYNDNGDPIYAEWRTKMDDLGEPAMFKTILKKGTGVTPMRFAASSANIYFITDRDQPSQNYSMSTVFDFDDIDFGDMNFGALENPDFVPYRRKVKKVKMVQTIIENSAVNESFGIFNIVLSYQKIKYIKR